jgi:hypothetical protein
MGMFDDLIEQHAPKATAGFSFEEAHGLDQKPGPIAAQFGGSPGMPEGISETASAPPDMQGPSRFGLMADQAFHGGSVGALTDRVNSGQVDQQAADQAFRAIVEARQAGSPVALRNFNPTAEEQKQFANSPSALANPHVGVPLPELEAKFNDLTKTAADKRAAYDAERAKTKAQFDALEGTFDAPTLGGKVANVITDAGGMLVGGAANPENLIGGGGGRAVKQAGESAVKFALKTGAEDLGRGAAGGAVGGAAANPAVQAGEISRGEREKYSPEELAANVVLGGAIGAAFHLPGMLARPILERIAARRGVPIDKLDPDHVSQKEVDDTIGMDPELVKSARAAGIPLNDAEREAQARYRAKSTTPSDLSADERNTIVERKIREDLAANPGPDPRLPVLEQKLAARKDAEALRTPDQPAGSLRAQDAEVGRRQAEVQGVTDETINPAATNIIKRTPDETPIRVDREGNAFRADAGALEGKAKAEALQRADMKLLPAPGRAVPTEEEIAQSRAANEGGRQSTVETPPKLYGQEGRAPQDSAGLEGQRQAGEAFTIAQRQRDRAGADVRDTQTAGRPEGANPQTIHLDEGHPVQIVNRRMVPDAKGNMVDVATVRRYDQRTGKPAPDHVEYDVPARQLKTGEYAQEPRMAQDFEARAGTPEGEQMGLPRQTYRTTPPDDNAAGTARAAPLTYAPPRLTIVAVLHALERERRGDHLMARPRRVVGSKSRHASDATTKASIFMALPKSVAPC